VNLSQSQKMAPRISIPDHGVKSLFISWWRETIWLFLACGLMASISVTLMGYTKDQQPEWNLSINLSTSIALMATLMRVCLISVVEAGTKLTVLLSRQSSNLNSSYKSVKVDALQSAPATSAAHHLRRRQSRALGLFCAFNQASTSVSLRCGIIEPIDN
jgi:Protein of unknown function (DUF3176)